MEPFVSGSYFDVTIVGIPTGPVLGTTGRFTRVSGLGAEFEYEFYNEGGSNYHRAFFKQVKQQTLVLEQGTVTNFDAISLAMNLINLGTEVTFTIVVILYDYAGNAMREWTIMGAHLTKYEGPSMDSNQSELAVSRMEFIYNGAF